MRIMAPDGHAKLFVAEPDGRRRPRRWRFRWPDGFLQARRVVRCRRSSASERTAALDRDALAKHNGYRYTTSIDPPGTSAARSVSEFGAGLGARWCAHRARMNGSPTRTARGMSLPRR
jgi:hypothetical protein